MRLQTFTTPLEDPRVVYSLVRLSADANNVEKAPTRRPINLALVVDRSSSMRGPRLAQAALAVRQIVDRLEERDRLSIVAFDAQTRVLFAPAAVTPEARVQIGQALDELRTGAGTNLYAGLKKGCELVGSGFVREALARVILLTDGQASMGPTDPDKLCGLAAEGTERSITTTTMGIGEGFDDDLLDSMARAGKGSFYYLANAAAIPAAFGRELSGVFSIAATDVELKILPQAEIATCEVLHRLTTRATPEGLIVELGEVAANAPRQILVKLVRTQPEPGKLLAKLALTFRDAEGKPSEAHLDRLVAPSLPLSPDVAEVALERLRLAVVTAIDEAWARRAGGHRAESLQALANVRAAIAGARERNLAPAPALDALLGEITATEGALATAASEREKARRAARERSHVTLLGHSVVQPVDHEEGDEG
jgi:Ca-activated chloride channel family protein